MRSSFWSAAVAVVLITAVTGTEFYDICDQVTLLGYPCEHHIALTEDGFELDIVRLPPASNASSGAQAYPVVLQHGLTDSAVTWVANAHPYQNLGCILHDLGYDIWMPNSRGNHYSMGNIYYSQSDVGYWRRIDMDGMALYDMPAVIAKVLNHSAANGFSTLSWVGHSQGTWQAFSAFSTVNRGLASYVDLFIALAPVAYVGHTTSLLLKILAGMGTADILALFGQAEFLTNDWLLRQFSKLCADIGETCPSVLELLCGSGNPANTNSSQLPIILRYDPGGTSVNNMIHWQQEVNSGTYAMHDYGSTENQKLYGQATAPNYILANMTAPPTALFSGSKDALADPTDVATLIADLPNATVVGTAVIEGFAHLDFVWGLDAHKLLYNPYVVPLLEAYRQSPST